jgi:myo-inositol-1(or 4)-monophosphatase
VRPHRGSPDDDAPNPARTVASGHQADRELAERAARRGAAAAAAHFGRALTVERKRTLVDVVTAADHAAEEAVVELIARERPDDGLVGEEGAARAGSGRRWVVDGLDGTFNFVSGVPHWCTAVALQDAAGTVAAAVHDAVRDEHFSAARGLGCAVDGRPAAVRTGRALPEALVSTFLRTDKLGGREAAPVLGALAERAGMLRMGGSGSLDLAWVAAGRIDGWVQPNVDEWDWLPGALLVQEAGGRCAVLPGSPVWHVAGAPEVADGLVGLVGDV